MGNAQRVINSGVRGVVAAMAMSGTRALTHSLGLVDQTPPEAVLHQQAPALMAKFPREKRLAVTELAHWTFGAVARPVAPPALGRCRLRSGGADRFRGGHRPSAGAVSGSAYAAGGASGIPGRPYALRHRARPTTARISLIPFQPSRGERYGVGWDCPSGVHPNPTSAAGADRVRLGLPPGFD